MSEQASSGPQWSGPNGRKPVAGGNGSGARPRWGFFTLSGCRGCESVLLDVHSQVAPLTELAEVVFWPWLLGSRLADLEQLQDQELDAVFVAGAVVGEADEKVAHLLRRKSRRLVALGACASFGGLAGLADNPEGGPEAYSLSQKVKVDFFVPGCAPALNFTWAALQALAATPRARARISYAANIISPAIAQAILSGIEPPSGTYFAGDKAVCASCSRFKEEKKIVSIHRPHEINPDEKRCLLEQGVVCVGLATRGGCGGRCTGAGLPCRGCFGPAEAVFDPGASLVSSIASTIASDDPAALEAIVERIPDPLGTFYRYSLPHAMLRQVGRKNVAGNSADPLSSQDRFAQPVKGVDHGG